ncbi:RNA-guided endonuclease TnpB family protein [Okeania sp. KiyG1]|uniref:RNA-guided endonuclease InsQ/TnpB family protein n=1 Tax=Okeania sp. KiyG1 TaxID=2720165 RepID=UPI0027DA75D1|nr:RNA-guided endonuclease TnpB family protein [Okeania sp. KiyG1]
MHKLTTYLAKNHSQIVIEDLNVSGMMANHKLAAAVGSMGFYEFRRQLEYKCELYGSELIIIDRWFPSSKTCSRCGSVKESLLLSERVFNCEHCNFSCDCSATLARTRLDKSVKFSYGGQFAPQR